MAHGTSKILLLFFCFPFYLFVSVSFLLNILKTKYGNNIKDAYVNKVKRGGLSIPKKTKTRVPSAQRANDRKTPIIMEPTTLIILSFSFFY